MSKKRNKRHIPKEIMIKVSSRAGGKCEVCGGETLLCFGHKLPRSKGGLETEDNLIVLCIPCIYIKDAYEDLTIERIKEYIKVYEMYSKKQYDRLRDWRYIGAMIRHDIMKKRREEAKDEHPITPKTPKMRHPNLEASYARLDEAIREAIKKAEERGAKGEHTGET